MVTWQDVGLSVSLVDKMRSFNYERDSAKCCALVSDRVFHISPIYHHLKYRCTYCNYTKTLDKENEAYTVCLKCSRSIISLQRYSFAWHKPDILNQKNIGKVFTNSKSNFESYFNQPSPDVNVKFHDGKFRVVFAGGEDVYDKNIIFAIGKASILCPYLWDFKFDWKAKKKNKFRINNILESVSLISRCDFT